MRLVLHSNPDGVAAHERVRGPEVGHVFTYWTRAGVPVAYEPEAFAGIWPNDEPHVPTPGMVAVHWYSNALYAIDAYGVVVPLGMRIPTDYDDGSRLGLELETTGRADGDVGAETPARHGA
jgi:hypothetical protein